jgi:hypothetical protein
MHGALLFFFDCYVSQALRNRRSQSNRVGSVHGIRTLVHVCRRSRWRNVVCGSPRTSLEHATLLYGKDSSEGDAGCLACFTYRYIRRWPLDIDIGRG